METLVASHYAALNYRVTPDINLDGNQIDLLCYKHVSGIGALSVAVEIKYRSRGSVGVDEVRRFKAIAHELRRKGLIQIAVMVANESFTQDAQAFARDDHSVKLLRLQDLEEDLFNFSESLVKLKFEYETDDIYDFYIPLAARWSKRTFGDATDVLGRQLQHPDLVVLVGGFGSGKTTLVDRLFYQMVCKRLELPTANYPVRLRLRTLLQYPDLWSFVSDNLLEHQYIAPTRVQFERHLAAGKFTLFLDGFDEIKTSAFAEDRAYFLHLLSPLIASNCPCIITTRPTYFESFDEMVRAVKKVASPAPHLPRVDRRRVAADAIIAQLNLAPNPSVDSKQLDNVVELEPLSEASSRAYLLKYEHLFWKRRKVTVDHVYQYLRRIYDLKELMQRPILLQMIAITALEGAIDLHEPDAGHVGPSMLYDNYTEICAMRDISTRPEGLTKDERLSASRALAMTMFRKGAVELSPSEVTAAIEELPFVANRLRSSAPKPMIGIEQIITDIRVCSFLSFSTNDNSFRFQHKSFFEFFVAQYIMLARLKDYAAFKAYEDVHFTSEILYFLGSFARDQLELGTVVRAGVNASKEGLKTSVLCRKIVAASGTLLGDLQLTGGEIAEAALCDITIHRFGAKGVTFRDFALRNLVCNEWLLQDCTVNGTHWSSIKFDRSTVKILVQRSELDEIYAESCDMRVAGNDWTLRHSAIVHCTLVLSGHGALVDVRIDHCDRVIFDDLMTRSGSKFTVSHSRVESVGIPRWCAARSQIRLAHCELVGLWIPPVVLTELADPTPGKEVSLELEHCRGIIFSDIDLSDFGTERARLFAQLYPNLSVIADPAVSRALRRRRGEPVATNEYVEITDPELRKALVEKDLKTDDDRLWPAREAIKRHGLTKALAALFNELDGIESPTIANER